MSKFKVGDKVSIDEEYIKERSPLHIIKKVAYGVVSAVSVHSFVKRVEIDLYNYEDIRYASAIGIESKYISLYKEPDYTQDLVMNDILVNLNRLEKKVRKTIKSNGNGKNDIAEV